jgi:hypothetical protein
MAIDPHRMFSFSWNQPPTIPEIREQRTLVVLIFEAIEAGRTRLTVTHLGWGEGAEWDRAVAYFEHAWKEVVLPRLQNRFTEGPVDWEDHRASR